MLTGFFNNIKSVDCSASKSKKKKQNHTFLGSETWAFGLCYFKDRKSLFLFNVTEGNSDTEAISVICWKFCSCLHLPEGMELHSQGGWPEHRFWIILTQQHLWWALAAPGTNLTQKSLPEFLGQSGKHRKPVGTCVELRKEGMQQLPISGTGWSCVIQVMVCKWIGKDRPNCEGRPTNCGKKCSTKVFVHKFNLDICHLTSAFPPTFPLVTSSIE